MDPAERQDAAPDTPGRQAAAPETAPSRAAGRLQVRVGFSTERGARPRNEDYVGAWLGDRDPRFPGRVVAAIADGVGGAKGGRVAAEIAVRGLIDGLLGQSEALGIRRTGARAVEAVNRWIHHLGRADPALEGMACTLTGVLLRGRRLHLLHVGDSRLYRLRDDVLVQLTTDHTPGRAGISHALTRAVGAEDEVRVDYAEHAVRTHDRLLLVTDGVHGGLSDARLAEELRRRAGPEETARRLTELALAARVGDNATALVLDVLDLPPPDQGDLLALMSALPILPPPRAGQALDGYALDQMLSDNQYSRVFRGRDTADGRAVVVKFPRPGTAGEDTFRQSYLRESWIAARVRSPFVGEVLEPPAERTTCLYTVMPWYDGETLEQRLKRAPPVGLREGLEVAAALGKAAAALHRAGVIHRDIKPDNVILLRPKHDARTGMSGLKLIDLGVARLPNLEEFAARDAPGTASYMAPELFEGTPADARTDLFAVGVTLWRMWSGGAYPYGEIEPFSRPRFSRPGSLLNRRPDLPAWLDEALQRALAPDRAERQEDVLELVLELETGLARGGPGLPRRRSLYDRNPLLVWQAVSAGLLLALLASLALR